MTQKDKHLLLVDLSARLPYEIKVYVANSPRETIDYGIKGYISILTPRLYEECIGLKEIKPYLRPMSSMTEEEVDEFTQFDVYSDGEYIMPNYETIDWLNAHYFDYRDLIPIGLALEASEGMYNKY